MDDPESEVQLDCRMRLLPAPRAHPVLSRCWLLPTSVNESSSMIP